MDRRSGRRVEPEIAATGFSVDLMAHKKRGQLTTSPEWAHHLRPFLRRVFWKGERQTARELIQEEAHEPADPGAHRESVDHPGSHDVALDAWRGIAAPKGTPRAVIAALESAIRATTESGEFIQASEKLYVRPAFLGGREFGELIAREDAQLARIMQLVGLKK